MEITIVKGDELFTILQQVNLLKVKFGTDDIWAIAPVLFSAEETVDILLDINHPNYHLTVGQEVMYKFQKNGNEYLISGEILDIIPSTPYIITIRYIRAQKHSNLRKFMRFDSNLKVSIKAKGNHSSENIAKNISKGGAMILSNVQWEVNTTVNLTMTFDSGNSFKAAARIVRKGIAGDHQFTYGIEFIRMTEKDNKIINNEISLYEKEYLKSLNILRAYKKKEEVVFDTPIALLSYEQDESYEIRETLVKMGAENFQVFHKSKYYADFFYNEPPKIVIVDSTEWGEEILGTIQNIVAEFANIYLIFITSLTAEEKLKTYDFKSHRISVLFKPLIYNEFESEMIKYL